jgi:hypothetical protein
MLLMTEFNEDIKIISEANASGGKNWFIEGVFMQGMIENKNKRTYPTEILQREANRYTKDYIDRNCAYGELGHPSGPSINLDRVSHLIQSLKQEGNNFIGRAKITNTPYGNIVSNLMSDGACMGVSTRGLGSLKESVSKKGCMEVQQDFHLATPADIVADPSAPDAFVRGIMEGKEWVWENGIIKESEIAKMKKHIDEAASKKLTEAASIQVFSKFMSKLSGK